MVNWTRLDKALLNTEFGNAQGVFDLYASHIRRMASHKMSGEEKKGCDLDNRAYIQPGEKDRTQKKSKNDILESTKGSGSQKLKVMYNQSKHHTRPLPPRGGCLLGKECTILMIQTPDTWDGILVCVNALSFANRLIIINCKTVEIILNVADSLTSNFPLQKSSYKNIVRRWNTCKSLTIFKNKYSSDVNLASNYCDETMNTVIRNVLAPTAKVLTVKFDNKRLKFKCVRNFRQDSILKKNTRVRRTGLKKESYKCGHNSSTDLQFLSGNTLTRTDAVIYNCAFSVPSTTTWKGFESGCFELPAFPNGQPNVYNNTAVPGSWCSEDADSSDNISLQTNFTQINQNEHQLLSHVPSPANVQISEVVNMEEDNPHTQNGFGETILGYIQYIPENRDWFPVSNSINSVQNTRQNDCFGPSSGNIDCFHNTTQTTDSFQVYCKHPDYEDFNCRLATYVHWPSCYLQHPTVLSDAGLFYSGNNDCVICYRCGIELSNWSTDDDPLEKHVKTSPECPFLEQKLGPDKLQFLRDRVAHRVQYCSEASTSFQSDFVSYEGRSLGTSERDHIQTEIHPADFARSPEYAAYNLRLSTFKNWPTDLPQRPPQLADAGFYYTGVRDVVRCYVCDGGLQKWDPNDDAWIEHARWFSTCPYVLRVKGQGFVDLVVRSAEESDEEIEGLYATAQSGRNQMQTNNLPLKKDATIAMSKSTCIDKRLNTAAAESVLCMGYSRKAVLMVLDILRNEGHQDPKAEMILKILMNKEDAGEELPRDSSSPPPKDKPFEDMYKTDYEPPSDPKDLLNENQMLVEKIKCLDCHERNKNVLFLPCTHHELCEVCAADVIVCPKCWREVKQKVKTFMC